jgi:hypothetical protein
MKKVLWTAAVIAALHLCLLLISGGLVVYRSQQYGYVFRKMGTRPGIEFQCFIQSTNTDDRYGPILWDQDAGPYWLTVKAYDLTSGNEIPIQCNELVVNGVPQQPGLVGAASPSGKTFPLSVSFERDTAVSVDVSISTTAEDGMPVVDQLSGAASRQRPVTRVYSYWWYNFRKGWAG